MSSLVIIVFDSGFNQNLRFILYLFSSLNNWVLKPKTKVTIY